MKPKRHIAKFIRLNTPKWNPFFIDFFTDFIFRHNNPLLVRQHNAARNGAAYDIVLPLKIMVLELEIMFLPFSVTPPQYALILKWQEDKIVTEFIKCGQEHNEFFILTIS